MSNLTKANPYLEMSVKLRRLKLPYQKTLRNQKFQKRSQHYQLLMFLEASHSRARIITPQTTRMKRRSLLTRKASVTLKKKTLTLFRMKLMMTSTWKITSDSKLSW